MTSLQSEVKRVFIVGCPRSGTTWVQLLLAQHPAVATSQETHLFARYLKHLERMWIQERDAPASERQVGLRNVFTEAEFYQACRDFGNQVFKKIAALKPGATVVVEKTPAHVRRWELILKLYPDAYFVHVIRDPRSVVCSLRRSAGGWGWKWAPSSLVDAAKRWCSDVARGRKINDATGRYREVIYERLLEDGADQLRQLLSWLDLRAEPSFCDKAVAACAIENLQKGSENVVSSWSLAQEPQGFFRKGNSEGWREDLSSPDLLMVEHLAGDLMEDLGYTPALGGSKRKPLRLLFRERSRWLRDRLRWRLGAAVNKL